MRLYAADMVLTIEFGVNACCLNISVNAEKPETDLSVSGFMKSGIKCEEISSGKQL